MHPTIQATQPLSGSILAATQWASWALNVPLLLLTSPEQRAATRSWACPSDLRVLEPPVLPKLAVLPAQRSALPGTAGRCGRWSRRGAGTPNGVCDRRRPRRPSAELGHLVVAISSDGVVLQGVQHPSGRIAHDLPLLVGQLCCAVFHNPGDPWQVMDHPWCEPLARRQERMRVVVEKTAAGGAPRGGRCHGI